MDALPEIVLYSNSCDGDATGSASLTALMARRRAKMVWSPFGRTDPSFSGFKLPAPAASFSLFFRVSHPRFCTAPGNIFETCGGVLLSWFA